MISSRSLDDLTPEARDKVRNLIMICKTLDIDLLITSTYRDNEAQAALYAQGRTAQGAIVTNAKPGESYHNYRCAADFAPIVNGKIDWTDQDLFKRVGEIAESIGMDWAGRWTGAFRELAHVQYSGGLTLAQLQNGNSTA